MNDKLFKRILWILLGVGVISLTVLIIITIVLYRDVSMITFIEKELW